VTNPPQEPPPEQARYEQQPGYGAGQPAGAGQPYGAMPPAPSAPPPGPAFGSGQYADLGKRFLARLLDIVIVGVPLAILYFILVAVAVNDSDDGAGAATGGALIIFYVIAVAGPLAYEVGMIATRGATIGKQVIGVKVVREADGQVPGGGPAFLRWLIPFVGGFVCGIGQLIVYLSPFFDNSGKRQGWHDKVAKTVVIATK
jgi:uncharacterized RDD family membrane protein YckC